MDISPLPTKSVFHNALPIHDACGHIIEDGQPLQNYLFRNVGRDPG